MKAQTSYLDLEERNGLVYEIGLPNPFTGLVKVPFLDLTGKLYYSKSYQDYFYGSAKAEGKEFLSSYLDIYQEEAVNCDVDSILDIKASWGDEEHIRNFVCEFRYKSGLKHGTSRELIPVGFCYGQGCWRIIEEEFFRGRCEKITFYTINGRIINRGCCIENFKEKLARQEVFPYLSGEFPDEFKHDLWEYYDKDGNLEKTEIYKTRELDE